MQKRINSFTAKIITTALGLIDNFLVSKIKNEDVATAVRNVLDKFKQTVVVLSSKSENITEELKTIWCLTA